MACVDVCSLALQLWARRRGLDAVMPAAVVDRDAPQGLICEVNERAWKLGVRPGQRYASALGLSAQLQAGVVCEREVERGVAEIAETLLGFSPFVEPSREQAGVFWVDASGLGFLYEDLTAWADSLLEGLCRIGFVAAVVVGFTRFGAYAVARSRRGALVLSDRCQERRAVRRVRLERLGVRPDVRDQLALLNVHTVGDLAALPGVGLRQRYGAGIHRWWQLATGQEFVGLQAVVPLAPVSTPLLFDAPERNYVRLLFVIKRALLPMLRELHERGSVLAQLELTFHPGEGDVFTERIRPAEPTCDDRVLVDLVRLRLESMALRSGVVELVMTAQGVEATAAQLALFAQAKCARDLDAAGRALARVRAEFGEGAVTLAQLRQGHMPEARFQFVGWTQGLAAPSPTASSILKPTLVRRALGRPRLLSSDHRGRQGDGWLVAGLEPGPVVRSQGPYLIRGGWWVREVERAYHYLELAHGDVLWVYWDARRRAWFQHGSVE